MPKIKTNRGAAKRFKKTSTGYRHRQAYTSHNFSSKSTKRKRQLRKQEVLLGGDKQKIRLLLGD